MYQHVVVKDNVLWIDGIHMHRSGEAATPQQHAKKMVDQVNLRQGYRVLDICTGLGYTALAAAKQGATVTTIEQSSQVLTLLAQHSPSVLQNKNIEIIEADALDAVKQFDDATFNAIIHDPPRFSMAGQLYSQAFYAELYRILKPGAKMFHYTGKPGIHSGKNMLKGIKNRLTQAGFKNITWVESALGFTCTKP